jgi:DNA-binding transcriptional MerR regulator/methylmalonyl-CoA mutase cobalamin-binding subunit
VEEPGALRIGELSRRAGVSDHVLRAWETRYGLLRPTRSAGGYRLYSAADERRVRRMKELIADGLSAAEAARAVVAERAGSAGADELGGGGAAQEVATLRAALDGFDEPSAKAVLDRLLSRLSLTAVLREVVLPYLQDLGDRWERGSVSVAQEHFASNLLRGRLAGLALGWGAGAGPRALLACPPGELHDLPLLIFGITLNRLGWRVTYLGSNTPLAELFEAAEATRPDVVVLAAVASRRFEDIADGLTELGRRCPLALAGAGAHADLARRVGARLLPDDPVSEAQAVARSS